MTTPLRIILIGHCGPDAFALASAARRALAAAGPGVAPEIIHANDQAELDTLFSTPALALVNRKLDGDFTASSGVELIRLFAPTARARLMLITGFPTAQADAIAAGGVPGFSKRDMNSPAAAVLMREAVQATMT